MSNSRKETFLRLTAILFGLAAMMLSQIVSADADTYTYDALGRLKTVTFADGSTITYAYDSAGNRTTLTQTAAP